MLRREGWAVNTKRIYRLYTEDGLAVRTKVRKKIARPSRVPALRATRPNENDHPPETFAARWAETAHRAAVR
jgi:putative transposase